MQKFLTSVHIFVRDTVLKLHKLPSSWADIFEADILISIHLWSAFNILNILFTHFRLDEAVPVFSVADISSFAQNFTLDPF